MEMAVYTKRKSLKEKAYNIGKTSRERKMQPYRSKEELLCYRKKKSFKYVK